MSSQAGYHAECTTRGCHTTFRIPDEGKFINFRWYCATCARIMEKGPRKGVTVAKQLVESHEFTD